MEIKKTVEATTVKLSLSGRLDTITSGLLNDELETIFFQKEAGDLLFDFSQLDYISSSGLRVLLTAQKKVNSLGTKMKIVGANDTIKEVFEATGFTEIMDVS
jgi:anti-sigma B factor antagonist